MILDSTFMSSGNKYNVSIPAEIASLAAYWINGLSTMGNNSLGIALVAGRNLIFIMTLEYCFLYFHTII